MRWVVLLAELILAAHALLACPAATAQDWAVKMFNKLEHDFGDVAKGTATEYRFQIKNLYLEDMRIKSVRASCGCTTPSITKELLKSGETSELVARFNTDRFEGQHGATLTVRFASPFPAEVRVKVKGYVRRDVVIHPGRIEFGSVESEEGVEKRVRVYYAGRDSWELTDVRSRNEHFEVELIPLARSDGRVNYELLFRLKKNAPAGYITDRLTLVTNDANRKFIPLVVEGNVIAPLTVSPVSLQLGIVRPGESVTKQLVVRGKAPFSITKVDCSAGAECFQFQTTEEPRTLHLIPVTFTANSQIGKFVERIQIVVDDGSRTLPDIVAHVEVRQ
ncbi:MAG: DUF1573 domain-containing protein [Planctomycetales bacterium]|nr:DUF1573 domain-containing protein [Planctomycetales bacterium]NIM07735.1 DUF1573 domain-containing protein [Planctomycetales bacterium]NIN07234.1 DUF1573 domain-containing protein [Planctomycetales bacterium]NIN76327.1 DUF1573 domain-containing protein [Planctomycetales bacterium]NIO34944.1 DUF1573 domain-containing protein [Planctomycetales bacterium]